MEPDNRENQRFTQRDDERLTELFNAGHTDINIGKALRRTWMSIKMRRVSLGLRRSTKPLFSNEDLAIIRAMFANGRTDLEISQVLGRSCGSIKNQRCKMGIYKVNPGRLASFRRSGEARTGVPRDLPNEAVRITWAEACTFHLIDLMRDYGGPLCQIGVAKAEYRARCEHAIPEGATHAVPRVTTTVVGSSCGSPAYMCVA